MGRSGTAGNRVANEKLRARAASNAAQLSGENAMKRYVIEREVPGIGSLTGQQLSEAARKSCDALEKLGTDVQWIESFVAADKTFCIYLAKDEATVQKHAQTSGFPANIVTEVRSMLDPTMAA
jgi:hypothetical protein